tara:strand:+ start:91 stop:1191 length:1101 start_codon:yes stop_codon:yes gene_type:complete
MPVQVLALLAPLLSAFGTAASGVAAGTVAGTTGAMTSAAAALEAASMAGGLTGVAAEATLAGQAASTLMSGAIATEGAAASLGIAAGATGSAAAAGVSGTAAAFGSVEAMQLVNALGKNTEAVSAARTVFSAMDTGIWTAVTNPVESLAGTFDKKVNSVLQKDAFQTDSVQVAADIGYGMVGGPILEWLPVIGLFAKATKGAIDTMIQMPRAITQWSESMVASQLKLAKYNGELQAVSYKKEYRDISRDMSASRATSGSTAGLSDALNDLKDTAQPFLNDMTNIMNQMLTVAVRMLDAIIKIGAGLLHATAQVTVQGYTTYGLLVKIFAWVTSDEEDTKIPWIELMDDIVKNFDPANAAPAPAQGI